MKQRSVVLTVLGQACRKDSAWLRRAHLRRKSRNTRLVLPPQGLVGNRTGALFHMLGRWEGSSAAHCIPLLFGKDCSLTSTPFWIFCWGLQLHGLNLLPLVSHENCSFSLLFYYLLLQPCSTNCIQISSTTIHVPLIISIGYNQASVEEPRTFCYTHDLPR